MRITSKIRYFIGRRVQQTSNFDYEQMADYKWDRLRVFSKRYNSEDIFEHKEKLYEEFVYGHSIHLAGTTPNNNDSLKISKKIMHYVKPNLLILGGLSDNYLRLYQSDLGIRKHYEHPLFRPEKMQCKERMVKMIQMRLQSDHDIIWNQTKKQMYTLDHRDRRMISEQYLTVAHMSSTQDHTRLALGKPSDTLVLEDLIMRYEVGELKEMAERAIAKCRQRQDKSTNWGHSYIREAIQNYVMSEEPDIYYKEMTYQTALLKKYAKLYDKILLFLPGYFIERVAAQVHHIDVNPESIYRDRVNDTNSEVFGLLQKTLQDDPQTILEKFALLVMMKESWIQNEFAQGSNVFQNMLFGELFKDMSISQLHARYYQAKANVEGKWKELIQHRVNNLHVQPGPHIKLPLAQQFNLVKDRATKDFPYTYQQKNYLSVQEDKVKMNILYNKMKDYLNAEGDKNSIYIFDKFIEGYMTKEGIVLFSKLLGRMNVEMEERLKLPIFHYGAFRGVYKEYLRDFLIRGDQNSRIEEKIQNRKQKIETMLEKHMKKLENPYELEKFLTSDKGKKAVNLDFNLDEGPNIQPEDLQKLQGLFGEVGPQEEQELRQQFGEDWDQIVEDEQSTK